jgi:hypothetical protein
MSSSRFFLNPVQKDCTRNFARQDDAGRGAGKMVAGAAA